MVPNHHNYDGIDSSHVEKDHDSDQIQHGLDQFHQGHDEIEHNFDECHQGRDEAFIILFCVFLENLQFTKDK